jgi:hypothetical protein
VDLGEGEEGTCLEVSNKWEWNATLPRLKETETLLFIGYTVFS